MIGQVQRDTKKNYQLYGRNDMIMLDEHNKIYGSLGLAEPYIVATKEGETLLLNGAKDNEPFIGLSLYGKSHQNTVAGNQLFVAGKDKLSYTADDSVGLTTTYDPETGWFHVTGTLTGLNPTFWREENLFNMKGGVQYYFSVETVGENDYIALAESDIRNAFSRKNMSFAQQVDTNANQIYANHRYEVGTEFDLKFRIMVSMGSTALPYEPYTGGQPSPNPDYPQEIEITGKDGEIGVDVYGGNLFDASKCNIDDAPVSEFQYFPISVQEDGQYTLSSDSPMDGSGGSGISALICFLSGNVMEGASSYDNGVYDGHPITQSSENGYVTIAMRKSLICSALDYNIMLNIGTTALPFEPYKQPQSLIVSTPNGLPGIPVSSDGNYTDESGQQWISDEVDYRREKYVKRTELLHITDFSEISNPTYTDLGNTECNIQILGHYPDVQNMSHVDRSMCDSFIYSAIGDYERFVIGSDTELRVYFTLNGVLSREEFIAKMEEISPTILFPLAAPIETDLTPEQITAYQSLHTNYPTTTVTNDEGAGMKAIYKQIENGG